MPSCSFYFRQLRQCSARLTLDTAQGKKSHWYLRRLAARLSPAWQAPPDLHCGHRLVFDICISTANWIRPASRRSSQACATCTPQAHRYVQSAGQHHASRIACTCRQRQIGSGFDSRARYSLYVVAAEICQGPGTVSSLSSGLLQLNARPRTVQSLKRRVVHPRPRQVPPYPMCVAKPP